MKSIVLLFLFTHTFSSEPYWPLAVGNTWTYFYTNDTETQSTLSVNEIVDSLDQSYYVVYSNDHPQYHLRWDESWCPTVLYSLGGYIPNVETPWIDFHMELGEIMVLLEWEYEFGIDSFMVALESIDEVVETPVGIFNNCRRYHFYLQNAIDSDMIYVFAENIGIVRMGGSWYPERILLQGSIDGQPIGCTIPYDANNDQYLDILDIVEVVNFILGMSNFTCDIDHNEDGVINVLDIIEMVNIILEN